jgi:hypothetical protein
MSTESPSQQPALAFREWELFFDPLPHGAINCATEDRSESGNSSLNKMARDVRVPSEAHPNGKEQ